MRQVEKIAAPPPISIHRPAIGVTKIAAPITGGSSNITEGAAAAIALATST